ncbi:MAG: hypothetical protein U0270_33840 [Labilithrix sp.]
MRGSGSALVTCSLVMAAIIAACSGPGAGKSTFESGEVNQESSSGKSVGGDDDDDTTSSSSSGAAAGDAVFGTTTFAYKAPPQNANDHKDATHANQTPLEGKDCVTAGCHLDVKVWAFAGTVYSKIDGTTTVAQAEVGVVYGNTLKSAMTDANGNFWLDGTDFPPANAKVGVRIAGKPAKLMNLPLPAAPAGRACNSTGCHGAAANRIWIE